MEASERNIALKRELQHMIEKVNRRSTDILRNRANTLKGGWTGQGPKKELEQVVAEIARKKAEIEKMHQASAVRGLHDKMRDVRQKLRSVNAEIEAASAVGEKQSALLNERLSGSSVLDDLESELVRERKVNAELRKHNADLERELRTSHAKPDRKKMIELDAVRREIAMLQDEILSIV